MTHLGAPVVSRLIKAWPHCQQISTSSYISALHLGHVRVTSLNFSMSAALGPPSVSLSSGGVLKRRAIPEGSRAIVWFAAAGSTVNTASVCGGVVAVPDRSGAAAIVVC